MAVVRLLSRNSLPTVIYLSAGQQRERKDGAAYTFNMVRAIVLDCLLDILHLHAI